MPSDLSPTDRLRALEDLLADLFRPDQLRRFIEREFGGKLSRQLPGEHSSAESLFHGAAEVLQRNGHVDADLFGALMQERPQLTAEIRKVAGEFGLEVAQPALQQVAQRPVADSEKVIQDTYEDLRDQQKLIREFLSGPWAQLNQARMAKGQDPADYAQRAEACRAWTTTHARRVTTPEVRGALEFLTTTSFINPTENGFTMLLAALTADKWAPFIAILEKFSSLTPKELHQLANRPNP